MSTAREIDPLAAGRVLVNVATVASCRTELDGSSVPCGELAAVSRTTGVPNISVSRRVPFATARGPSGASLARSGCEEPPGSVLGCEAPFTRFFTSGSCPTKPRVPADPKPGAHTPGSLLGPDFALRVPGVRHVLGLTNALVKVIF